MTELTGMRGLTTDELELVSGAGSPSAGEVAGNAVAGAAIGATEAALLGAVGVAIFAAEVAGWVGAAAADHVTKNK